VHCPTVRRVGNRLSVQLSVPRKLARQPQELPESAIVPEVLRRKVRGLGYLAQRVERRALVVALQVAFERQTLKPLFSLDRL
jgi:hypothetical protein